VSSSPSARRLRRLRLALLALLVLWFVSPPEWRYLVPLWLPFLVALGLEVQFFVGGIRGGRSPVAEPRNRGPQPRDLDELGWSTTAEAPDEESEEFWHSAPAPRRPRPRPNARSILEAGAVLAVVAAVVLYVGSQRGWSSVSHAKQARTERLLSREATTIATHPARVTCDTSGRHVGAVQEADGLAEVGGREAYLTPDICYTLFQLADRGRVSSFSETARAIAVLAHEAWHLRGVADEGVTNCYAFQSGVRVGTDLGLSPETARRMMRQQLADNAVYAQGDTRYLVPPGCRNGGQYDLAPGSSRFP
jgi:hypothetical protein